MGGSLFGTQYSTRLTESNFINVASFNPVQGPLPLDIPTVAKIAVDWITQRFQGQPAWLDNPQWSVRSVMLENVHDDQWVYKVTCRLGLGARDEIIGESFCVVVLANGSVVEPVTSEFNGRFDYVVAPPPLADIAASAAMISLNFNQAPLEQLLDFYAHLTGWRIVREQGVNAIITIKPKDRVTPAVALGLMEAVLKSNHIILEKTSDSELTARRWKPMRNEKDAEKKKD